MWLFCLGSIGIRADSERSEAFDIRVAEAKIDVVGADANGAMCGGIEVAESL